MSDIHYQHVEIQVGEKMLPVTDWHIDCPPLDHSGPMPSPEAIADLLDVKASYELQAEPDFLEAIMGDYRPRNLEPGVWYHEFLSCGICIPATYTIYSQKTIQRQLEAKALKRRQERWKKIRRRQKRAAFRRWKRGIA